MFSKEKLVRNAEDIQGLCTEMRSSIDSNSDQFAALSYEEGVLATVRWLFFTSSESPYDTSRNAEIERRLGQVKLSVYKEEIEQMLENRD